MYSDHPRRPASSRPSASRPSSSRASAFSASASRSGSSASRSGSSSSRSGSSSRPSSGPSPLHSSSRPSYPRSPYFTPAQEVTKPAIIFGILCLLLPPIGLLCAWRSRRMIFPVRLILSGIGFVSMTIILTLLMLPSKQVSSIRPTPSIPSSVGYTAALPAEEIAPPAPPQDAIPAQPNSSMPSNSSSEPIILGNAPLSDDSIVYAVTNNASSYHLYEICDYQENRRPLTLRDARNEGLQPCPKCVGATE